MNNHKSATITVSRFRYEEPYHTQLLVSASNGFFGGITDFYCPVNVVPLIGTGLVEFAAKLPDEYQYVYGSTNPAARLYRYFMLRAYRIDGNGKCAIQFVMDLNRTAPDEGRCRFTIKTEPAAIERLGKLFLKLYEKSPSGFRWTQKDDEFFDKPPLGEFP